jgi:hypothetical protein
MYRRGCIALSDSVHNFWEGLIQIFDIKWKFMPPQTQSKDWNSFSQVPDDALHRKDRVLGIHDDPQSPI